MLQNIQRPSVFRYQNPGISRPTFLPCRKGVESKVYLNYHLQYCELPTKSLMS